MSSITSETDEWLQRGDWDALARFVSKAQREGVERAVALRLRGHLRARDHAWAEAFESVEAACQVAAAQREWPLAIHCALDLARWSQSRENMASARSYLERARRYAEGAAEMDLLTQAKLALTIGRLAPDLEQTELGAEWCARSLALYEQLGDAPGQVDALWNLAVCNTYIGRLLDAADQAQRALRLHRIAGLDPGRELYLLNLVAVLALARGDIAAGLEAIRAAQPLVARHPLSKPALYLADTEAALWRQRGDFDAAFTAHARAEAIMTRADDQGFRPWFEMERGWTQALAGEPPSRIRRALLAVGELQDATVRSYLTFYIALLDILESRWDDAIGRLTGLRAQFLARGERLHMFAADLYLAYSYFKAGQHGNGRTALRRGLSWAEENGVDGFGLWWHPSILAHVCTEALRTGIHPRQAEVMIVRRLGDAAVPDLLALTETRDANARQRSLSVLAALDRDNVLTSLGDQAEPGTGAVVREHLAKGRLTLSALPTLRARLEAGSAGATLQRIAVFGFYAATRMERDQIAEQLALSEGTVKKHVSAIRAAFGIESRGGRDAGRETVAQAARGERLTFAQIRL